jgi:hypothetical protein
MENYSFHPIAAMANVINHHYCARFGKQHLEWSLFNRLVKEVSLSLLNGVILAVILFVGSHYL